MKSVWKKGLAVLCAATMLMTAPGICVLADEMEQEEMIVSHADQVPEEAWDVEDSEGNTVDEAVEDSEEIIVEDSTEMAEPVEFPEEASPDASSQSEEPADTAEEEGPETPADTLDTETEELVGAGDDYPAKYKNAALDSIVDEWNFYNRECTSFVAWCLNSRNQVKFTNQYKGASRWGNANTWGTVAKSLGVTVNKTPAVGAVAWWNTGTYGHVAWVSKVSGSNVTIEEYNWGTAGKYGTRTIAASNPTGYIHIKDITTQTGTEMTKGYDAVLPNGDYQIVCYSNVNYYLDIDGGASVTNGTNVKIFGPLMNLNSYDVWTITYSNGFYKIKQKGANMCLDLKDGNKASGTNVQAYVDDGTKAQQWAISKYSDGKGYKVQSKCSGYCLDVQGGTIDKNTNVQQYPSNNTNAQRWLFIPYNPQKTIANGRYILVSALDPNLVLDISGDKADVADGTNVQIWTDNAPSKYNSIDVTYLDNGCYRLAHAASGKSIEVKDESCATKANIQISASKDARKQWWFIMKQGTGYRIVSRLNGLVIDVAGGETAKGTNIQQYYHNGSNSQIWKFVKAEYKVKYNANGGSGAPAAQTKYYRNALTLTSVKPTRSGYDFLGWATSSTASSAAYKSGGTYSADKDVTLYAVWKQSTLPPVMICSDVQNPSHPYYNAINWALQNGIAKGYSDGTFGTDRHCTRGEMMMFIWRYAGKPSPKAASKSPFKDVPTNHVFYNAILWGSQAGITKGYPDGTFGINRDVTRGACMMFLWRLKGKPASTPVSASPFKDVPTNHAYYKAILWGSQKKVTTGYTSGDKKGTFGIDESCTRGAIVTFLYRAKDIANVL